MVPSASLLDFKTCVIFDHAAMLWLFVNSDAWLASCAMTDEPRLITVNFSSAWNNSDLVLTLERWTVFKGNSNNSHGQIWTLICLFPNYNQDLTLIIGMFKHSNCYWQYRYNCPFKFNRSQHFFSIITCDDGWWFKCQHLHAMKWLFSYQNITLALHTFAVILAKIVKLWKHVPLKLNCDL